MTVGQRIKQRRIELNMSLEDLGKKLNKNKSTVYRYEIGDIEKMPIDIIKPIATALQTTPEYLMGWTEETIDINETRIRNDEIAQIVMRMRTDKDFLELCKKINKLDEAQLESVVNMLSAFIKE